MDPNPPHYFTPIEDRKAPNGWPEFTVGEEIEMHGVILRVRKVARRDIVLRPVRMAGGE